MAGAKRWAAKKGCVKVHLHSNAIREDAHRFCEDIGYGSHARSLTFHEVLEGLKSAGP